MVGLEAEVSEKHCSGEEDVILGNIAVKEKKEVRKED